MSKPLYGIFGGTFDPIHHGHLQTVASVHSKCALTTTLFIPSASPPHKGATTATAQQRMEMVLLAIADFPEFKLDRRELDRDAPSYTIDTVESLKAEYADQTFCFIIGMDAMLALDSWHRWDELLDTVHFIVMNRPGWEAPKNLPEWWQQRLITETGELVRSTTGKILAVEIEPANISSTEIRYGIANEYDVATMLPEAVWRYIYDHNIYHHN